MQGLMHMRDAGEALHFDESRNFFQILLYFVGQRVVSHGLWRRIQLKGWGGMETAGVEEVYPNKSVGEEAII